MKKGLVILLGLGALVLVLGLVLVSSYNGFVMKEEAVTSQWANVETVYQRRADLIPNLVETVKGYAAHEQETLQAVIEARAKATQVQAGLTPETLSDPALLQQFQQAQGQLGSALARLMVVVEQYPDLKANTNFLDLQAQLEGTENRIAVERRRYNEIAQDYNTAIRRFPGALIAGLTGFDTHAYFEAAEGAEAAPAVRF